MIGGIFKAFGVIMSGAGNMLAGGALMTSTALLNTQTRIHRYEQLKQEKIEQEQQEQQRREEIYQAEVTVARQMRKVSGKYKIVDIDNELDVLTSSNDLTEARAWLCEYRTNGYNVMIQTK